MFDLLCICHQLIGLDTDPALALKLCHPAGKFRYRGLDKTQQSGRGGLFLLQPFIHGAFSRPCHLTEIGQTNHATAAFQRMETPAYGN